MKYIYFDALAGLSGDMILGALLDLGFSPSSFRAKMVELKLPVKIQITETKRAGLRGLKVDVLTKNTKSMPRKWKDIRAFVQKSPFSAAVKADALAIFRNLFQAEARVHGHKFEEAHLHEAGADDALIDILGCCYVAEALNITAFYSSPLNVGQGWVKTSHGVLPVPPPAVAELLTSVPVYSAWVKEELVTPTGAAIVSTLVTKFLSLPELTYEKIGCGAGNKDFPDFPNILRIFYGDKKSFSAEKKVYTIEATIDDSSPQILAQFMDRAFELGALDVFFTPVVMKKNRLATKLTLLAEIDTIDTLTAAVFKETSSIGVRYYPVERRVLQRKIQKTTVLGEEIGIKISYLDGKKINIQPEFADCMKLARKKGLSVKEVVQIAIGEFQKRAK